MDWQPDVLDLDPLDLDAPGVGGVIKMLQDVLGDRLAVGEDLGEVLRAQNRPQGGGGQQLGALGVVRDLE